MAKDYYGYHAMYEMLSSHCFASVPAGGFVEDHIAAAFTNSNNKITEPAGQQCIQD